VKGLSEEIGTAHLQRLARNPRSTGSPEAADARQYCTNTLSALGYRVSERAFDYSAAVGSYGTPAGGIAALLLIVVARAAALGGHRSLALAALLVGAAVLALCGRWLARRGVLVLPIMRRRGINLEARRGDADPEVWLVAHLDSKSQPVSLVIRAAGVVVLLVCWTIALVVAVSPQSDHVWLYVTVASVVGTLPVLASVVGKESPGAVDNASGVATVLGAAAMLPARAPVGVLITDAEELGLAGARAWCVGRSLSTVLNCDGIDDAGQLTLMWTPPRARRVEQAFGAVRIIPLVPGVLVDSLAFSDAGWEAVTLSRGSVRTLRRIHTRHDSLDHLNGDGIASAARALAAAAITLTERH
jgi:Peptidase family M28